MNAHDVVKALVAHNIHPSPDGYAEDGTLSFTVGVRGSTHWAQVDVSPEEGIVVTEMTWRIEEDEESDEDGATIEFEDEVDDSISVEDVAELIEALQTLGFGDE